MLPNGLKTVCKIPAYGGILTLGCEPLKIRGHGLPKVIE
jgi:hypothetical protein